MGNLPKLEIVVNPNGTVSVNGPLHDRMMCYGLLEIARDVIRDWKPGAIIAPTSEHKSVTHG